MPETFSLTLEQAHVYEDLFVPALFAQWAVPLLECAGVRERQRVLDVACGTGVAARAALRVVGPEGHVSGVDLNPAMIDVAREIEPAADWKVGDAGDLPYKDDSFDVVLCQSALFFFPEPAAAVHQMARVVAPGGSVALQTYAGLTEQPGYRPFVDIVVRHAGPDARALLGTYWSKGDLQELRALVGDAGLDVQQTFSVLGAVAFPSVEALVHTEIQATPLASRTSESVYQAIVDDACIALAPYIQPSGALQLPISARFISARMPTSRERLS